MPGSKGSGRGKTSGGSRKVAGGNEKFLRDTANAIERIEAALLRVRKRKRGLEAKMEQLGTRWKQEVSAAVDSLIPDLSLRTLARLNVAIPGFLTEELRAGITAASHPTVPFWTWVFGGSKAFRARALRDAHTSLVARLHTHIERLGQKPEAFTTAAQTAVLYNETKTLLASAQAHEESLEKQLQGLQRVQATFADGRREVPKEMAEAIARSARPTAGAATSSGSGHEFNYVDDVLIPQLVWDSYFDRHGGHYYDRYERPRASERSREAWDRESEDRPVSRRTSRGDDGNASTRMDDAASASEGDASVRMSEAAPAREGRASARMSEPVIAEPFGDQSEGNASTRMSTSTDTFSDRSETGSGTSY